MHAAAAMRQHPVPADVPVLAADEAVHLRACFLVHPRNAYHRYPYRSLLAANSLPRADAVLCY